MRDETDGSHDSIREFDRQHTLLAWAMARIDGLVTERTAKETLGEWLDWVAYFTREHFGFQRRLLNECGERRDYVLSRVAAHCAFRRQLAQLYIDMMRRDPTVAERLRALCHDLQQDLRAHDERLADLVRNGNQRPRLRRRPRYGQLAAGTDPFPDAAAVA